MRKNISLVSTQPWRGCQGGQVQGGKGRGGGRSRGAKQVRADAMGEPVGPRRAVPVPTARQAPCAAGGPSRGPPTRIQLLGPSVDSDYLQHGPSAEEQLAEELQEAMAEARSHQKMAAQQPHTHSQTGPYQPEARSASSEADPHSEAAQLPQDLGEEASLQLQQSASRIFKFKHEEGSVSMPSADGSVGAKYVAEGRLTSSTVEPSEEELLQWQPVFPAKGQPAKIGASGKQKNKARFPAKKMTSTALPAAEAARVYLTDADSFPSFSSQQKSVSSLPATRIGATVSLLATTTTSSEAVGAPAIFLRAAGTTATSAILKNPTAVGPDTLQTLVISAAPANDVFSCLSQSSASLPASSALTADPADHSTSLPSSVSSLSHALHVGHAVLPQLALESLLMHSAHPSFPFSDPAVLEASSDLNWPAAHAPDLRHSMSSWSSQASDAPTLRHSTASASSVQYPHSPSSASRGQPLLTAPRHDAGTSRDSTLVQAAVGMPVQWHLLGTTELQAQTTALLSTLTISTDWDSVHTDAPQHGQTVATHLQTQSVTDAQTHGSPECSAVTQSCDSELLSATLATADLAKPEWREALGGKKYGLMGSSNDSSIAASSESGRSKDSSSRKAVGGHGPTGALGAHGLARALVGHSPARAAGGHSPAGAAGGHSPAGAAGGHSPASSFASSGQLSWERLVPELESQRRA
ncbi:hypothetical protein ABBQ38_010765 [Trebouxia sp. C0009 RCD-2024]